ncbi:MarR family transcriptional regulator [Streptomyces sp. CC219B]|uniref:MarR family transcriptional regulator n=1 Tax=Streptomyces sp. CC219B TaxID=3044574 RepID=UPI0024A92AF4|nr:MarR family transcriptional regulator [Streptomyces sp. CC219B]
MTTTAPSADARALGLAHYAARGVLETVLARYGTTFQQMIALRAVATAETPVERGEVVGYVIDSLKAEAAEADAVVEELLAGGLIAAEASRLRVTDSGRELFARTGAEQKEISARIWGGIPAEDLAAAGRVLSLVTERANRELATLSA